jgi:hypothetical protein
MKPNGKYFAVRIAVRAAVLTLFALGALTTLASAESVHGNFKLATETHWGRLLLTPGEYEFTMSKDTSGYMVTVRSRETGWSGMVLAEAISDTTSSDDTRLVLEKSEDGFYVRQLCLGDSGITLDYALSKSGKLTRLAKAPATSGALASAAEAR